MGSVRTNQTTTLAQSQTTRIVSNRKFPVNMNGIIISFMNNAMKRHHDFKKKHTFNPDHVLTPQDVSRWMEEFSSYLHKKKKPNLTWLNNCPGSPSNPLYKFVVCGKDSKIVGISLETKVISEYNSDYFTLQQLYSPQGIREAFYIFQGHLFAADLTTQTSMILRFICDDGSIDYYPLSIGNPREGSTEVKICDRTQVVIQCFIEDWKTITIRLSGSRSRKNANLHLCRMSE